MALYFFAVPAPALLLWAISLCTISVFIHIEIPHLTIVHFGKNLRVYTQPAINEGCMLKNQMRFWTMPEWLSILSWCIRPLFSVAMIQSDIRIVLQKILLSTPALRVLPPPTFHEYITCVSRISTSTPSQWTARSTPSRPRWRFGKPINKLHILDGY